MGLATRLELAAAAALRLPKCDDVDGLVAMWLGAFCIGRGGSGGT